MKPNVLVVVIDALRADRVGALGGPDLTPNIDAFADNATTFTNAHTTTNTTDPAVTSLQTGQHPRSNGVSNHGWRVTDEEKASVENVSQLPELLSEAGYRTGKFGRPLGRWHRHGFDHYPSQMESRSAFDSRDRPLTDRVGQLLDSVDPRVKTVAQSVFGAAQRIIPEQRSQAGPYAGWDDKSADRVIQNLASWIDAKDPFYSFVHLMDTHGPYTAPPELVKTYLHKFDYNVDRAKFEGWEVPTAFHAEVMDGDHPEVRQKYYFSDTPSTAVIDASYDASVTVADQRFGFIREILREQGVAKNTFVAVLSDHGESLTEHGIYYDHHGLYEVTTNIPLFIDHPDGSDGRVTDMVQLTDIAPTITATVDISGLAPDGHSLVPAITEGEPVDREFVLAEETHTQQRRMMRTDSHKLIYTTDDDTICRYCDIEHAPDTELYDLEADPQEVHNLGQTDPSRVADLRDCAADAFERLESNRSRMTAEEAGEIDYDDEQKVYDRLEALGYR